MRRMKMGIIFLLIALFASEQTLANDDFNPSFNEPTSAISNPVKPHLLCSTDHILGSKTSHPDDHFQLLSIVGVMSFNPEGNPPASNEVFQVYASFVEANSTSTDTADSDSCSGFVRADSSGRYHVIVPVSKSSEDRSLIVILCTEPVYACSAISVTVSGWKNSGPRPVMSAAELQQRLTTTPDQLRIGYTLNFSWCVPDDKVRSMRSVVTNNVPNKVDKYPMKSHDEMEMSAEKETDNANGEESSNADGQDSHKTSSSSSRKSRGLFDALRGRMKPEERKLSDKQVNNKTPIEGNFPNKEAWEKWMKRNWNDAGMAWIKRDEDKRNWNEAGMGWIKRKGGKQEVIEDYRDHDAETSEWMNTGAENEPEWMEGEFVDKPESNESEAERRKRHLKKQQRRRRSVLEFFNIH